MRHLTLLLLIAAGPALAQPALPRPAGEAPSALAARLPAQVAEWQRSEVTDFETRPGGQGLGAAVEYRPAAGPGVATVYLYDRGQAVSPAGVADELARAQRDIEALAPMRQYVLTGPRPAGTLAHGLRCLAFEQGFPSGARADSYACVGAVRGWYVKLRLTLPQGRQDAIGLLDSFGQAAAAILGEPVRPSPVAGATPPGRVGQKLP